MVDALKDVRLVLGIFWAEGEPHVESEDEADWCGGKAEGQKSQILVILFKQLAGSVLTQS